MAQLRCSNSSASPCSIQADSVDQSCGVPTDCVAVYEGSGLCATARPLLSQRGDQCERRGSSPIGVQGQPPGQRVRLHRRFGSLMRPGHVQLWRAHRRRRRLTRPLYSAPARHVTRRRLPSRPRGALPSRAPTTESSGRCIRRGSRRSQARASRRPPGSSARRPGDALRGLGAPLDSRREALTPPPWPRAQSLARRVDAGVLRRAPDATTAAVDRVRE